MIIKGNVQSLIKTIPIEELKEGDIVIDNHKRPRKVESVEKVPVSSGLAFEGWTKPLFSKESRLLSIYGEVEAKDGEVITIRLLSGNDLSSTITSASAVDAYKVTVHDADFIYVDGIPLEVERC